jgi:hypothetical protein
VGIAFLVTTTSGLPPELWDPLAPQSTAGTGTSGGVSVAVAIGGLVLFGLVGFLVGEWLPARGARPQFEDCWIAVWRSGTTAEFRVVVGHGPARHVIGRSEPFAAPAAGPIPADGPARAAHSELVARLEALGWRDAGATESGRWYQTRLVQGAAETQLAAPA